MDLGVENRVVVGLQLLPRLDGGVPVCALRGVRPALDEFVGGLVGCDHACAGTCLDRHVADGHPRFHRQRADRLAAVFEDVALSAAGTDLRNDREDEVLARHSGRQRAVDVDRHRLERPQRQRLCGHDVFDLTGADSHCEGTECAVRGRVAVAADHRHTGLGESELRTDHVDDALIEIAHGMQPDTELLAVTTQGLDLRARDRVGDGLVDVHRGDVVILGGDREIGAPERASGQPEAVEGLRAGHFVYEVQVDVDEVGLSCRSLSFTAHDHVLVPHLLRQSLSSHLLHLVVRDERESRGLSGRVWRRPHRSRHAICFPLCETEVSTYETA